jgi:hypothetical protein
MREKKELRMQKHVDELIMERKDKANKFISRQ